MINETINATANNCSIIYNVAEIFAYSAMDLFKTNGTVIIVFAIIGLISLLVAVGEKAFQGFKYLFLIFIAVPLIIIIGLLNKKNRRERLKEIGEIKAHLKTTPEKWKSLLFVMLITLSPIALVLFIIVVL